MEHWRLLKKNYELDARVLDQAYARAVSANIRKKYSQDAIEAILNNYLLDPTDPKYRSEFMELQEFRKDCKERAKEVYTKIYNV